MHLEIWLLPSLVALLCNGLSTFLPKLSLKSLRLLDLVVYQGFFFFGWSLAIPAIYGWPAFEFKGTMTAVISGVIGALGQLFYLVGLQRTSVAPVSTVAGLYPLVSTLLAVFLLDESVTVLQGAGIIFGVSSIIMLVIAGEGQRGFKKALDRKNLLNWLLPSLAAMMAWGVWGFIPKLALQSLPSHDAMFYAAVGDLIAVLCIFAYLGGKLQKDGRGVKITCIASLLTVMSMFSFFYALSLGSVAVVTTLTAMYPIITVILARVILKEKINIKQICAIMLALVSIGLLVS